MVQGVAPSWLDRKELRYKLRSSLRGRTSLKGLRSCGAPLDDAVTVRCLGDDCYYTKIASCASAWPCPLSRAASRHHRTTEDSRTVVAALAKGRSGPVQM